MEEEPARNFITFESQTTRWMVGELLNLCYEHETLLRDPVNWTRKAVAWAKVGTPDALIEALPVD